ncbi:hypothetical protein BDP67DRAFT_589745 [Colletotrichum lupini]|nr:hypothetical protein BDP67DRAFT_589745 [Colletotrichum lupini]
MSPNVSVPLFGLLLLLVAVSAFPSAWSLGYNVSLAKRVKLEVPGDDTDMDVWMRERTEITKPIVWEVSPGTDANTAIFRRFGRNSFSLGTNGLCGCSSLWIISRKGVYATHYWESISFAPEKEWRNPGETNAEVFERTVIDGLKSGIAVKGKPMQARLNRDEIADDHIKAYLIHPQRTWKNTPAAVEGYRVQWNRIKDTVKAIIPELASDDKWEEVIYNRLRGNDRQLFETALGHVLFQFSPDDQEKKKAALWVERRRHALLLAFVISYRFIICLVIGTCTTVFLAEILSFSEVVIRILEHHSHISDYSLQRIPHQEGELKYTGPITILQSSYPRYKAWHTAEAHWFQDHPFN